MLELALVLDGMLDDGIIHTHTIRTIPFAKIMSIQPYTEIGNSYILCVYWPKAPPTGLPGTFPECITAVGFQVLDGNHRFLTLIRERIAAARSVIPPC